MGGEEQGLHGYASDVFIEPEEVDMVISTPATAQMWRQRRRVLSVDLDALSDRTDARGG
jgi:hypothetical protein